MSRNNTPAPAFFSRSPFLLLLPAFVAGIILQRQLPGVPAVCWAIGLTTSMAAAIWLHALRLAHTRLFLVRPVALATCFLFAGGLLTLLQDIRNYPDWYGHHLKTSAAVAINITADPQQKEKTFYMPARVTHVYRQKKWLPARGNIKLFVYRKEGMPPLHAGMRFLVQAQYFTAIKNSGNPGAFDYAGYAARNGLFHQVFADARSLCFVQAGPVAAGFIAGAQLRIRESIRWNVTDSVTRSLLEASVLNERASLDATLLQAYSTTGIIHIIAISGMHITLLAGLILLLLRMVPLKGSQGLKYLIATIIVWAYIAITGYPPSAVRAAVMFSLLAAGVLLGRNGQTINTWAATALLLLFYNPYWLYDIGVQLSFLAVLSILLFYPAVRNWITTGNVMLNWLWQSVAVSIAAQVLVFPLVIYYFHQFPLLGLLASVPAAIYSMLLLYGAAGIGILDLCGIGCLWAGDVLAWTTHSFHRIILFLAGHTPESMRRLCLTAGEYWLFMLAVVCCCIYFYRKTLRYMYAGLLLLVLLAGSAVWQEATVLEQQKIVVYNVSHASLADVLNGSYAQPVFPDSASIQARFGNYVLTPSRVAFGIKEVLPASTSLRLFHIGGKRILFWDRDAVIKESARFPVDFLVITASCRFDPGVWKKAFRADTIIIDGSVPRWKAAKWKETLQEQGFAVHWVQEDGAWIYPAASQ